MEKKVPVKKAGDEPRPKAPPPAASKDVLQKPKEPKGLKKVQASKFGVFVGPKKKTLGGPPRPPAPTGARPSDGGHRPSGSRPSEPGGGRGSDGRPSDARPSEGGRPSQGGGGRPSGGRPSGGRPSEGPRRETAGEERDNAEKGSGEARPSEGDMMAEEEAYEDYVGTYNVVATDPLDRERRLNTEWLSAGLPLHDLRADRETGYVSRLLGVALEHEVGKYYTDLGMRDFRLMLAHIFKDLGVPYHAAAYRQVPAEKLATTLRKLGIPARSELMNAICDNLIWCEDSFVSFAKLVEMAGDMEADFIAPERTAKRLEAEAKRVVDEQQLRFDRERKKLRLEQQARERMYVYDPRQVVIDTIKRPEYLTPATIGVISALYDMYMSGRITQNDLIAGTLEVTGAKHAERLETVLETYHPQNGQRAAQDLRLQDVLVAALKDSHDEPTRKARPQYSRPALGAVVQGPGTKFHTKCVDNAANNPKEPYVSPITQRPLDGGRQDKWKPSPHARVPSDDCLNWIHNVLTRETPFPQIPLERDINLLKELCLCFADGWLTTNHFKQICDSWNLPVNQNLGKAIRDHSCRGRCSIHTLWKGMVTALEQQGCRL